MKSRFKLASGSLYPTGWGLGALLQTQCLISEGSILYVLKDNKITLANISEYCVKHSTCMTSFGP